MKRVFGNKISTPLLHRLKTSTTPHGEVIIISEYNPKIKTYEDYLAWMKDRMKEINNDNIVILDSSKLGENG